MPQVHHVAVAEEDVLALGDAGEAVGLHHVAERAVGLDARLHSPLLAPRDERPEEAVEDEVGQGEVIVVADVGRVGAGLLHEGRQVGAEVVAAPRAELLQEVRRPVGAVHLEAVAEDGAEGRAPDRVHHAIARGAQEHLHGLAAEVVEDRALHAEGGALHLLAGGGVDQHEDPPLAFGRRPVDHPELLAGAAPARPGLVGEHSGARELGRLALAHRRRDHGHEAVVAGQVRSEPPPERLRPTTSRVSTARRRADRLVGMKGPP